MNGTNGKQSDFPDVALVPYPVIVAATKGDPDADRKSTRLNSSHNNQSRMPSSA